MIYYVLTDTNGKTVRFKNAVSVGIDRDIETPADALEAVFACDVCDRDFAYIQVFDGNETVFWGLVDEQIESKSSSGVLLEISARGGAALLLDNEAMPQTYNLPNMDEIFNRHIKPYGFEGYIGENTVLNGEMTVSKGTSEWEVLETFAECCGLPTPKIVCGKMVDISGEKPDKTVVLSRKNRIISIKKIKKRCEIISKVYCRGRSGAGYEIEKDNPLALALGITRKRYINAADTVTASVSDSEKLIEEGNNTYLRIEAEFKGQLLCPLGTAVIISGVGKGSLLELTYQKDMSGETTRFVIG